MSESTTAEPELSSSLVSSIIIIIIVTATGEHSRKINVKYKCYNKKKKPSRLSAYLFCRKSKATH